MFATYTKAFFVVLGKRISSVLINRPDLTEPSVTKEQMLVFRLLSLISFDRDQPDKSWRYVM
jgi:hypothetical protein